jgi:SAM-dependent methyltransferase
MSEWFGTWFDSEYYHLLYKDRDYTEAEAFVAKLAAYLEPPKDALIHDLACGKGRHSIYLNKLGYHVEGSDYSANSIKHAKQHENDTLKFYVHDMRLPMPRKYDYILNLFTSFGYFNTEAEHLSKWNIPVRFYECGPRIGSVSSRRNHNKGTYRI